jgi:hypothetical protein
MKTKMNIAVKRTILILTIISGFQISMLQAKTPEKDSPALKSSYITFYAPFTPKEADFNDIIPVKAWVMVNTAPETPKEATFIDDDNTLVESPEFLSTLAPVTPLEANFNDSDPTDEASLVLTVARPNTPTQASFDDK